MSYLLLEKNGWNEFYMVQFIVDLNIRPDENGFKIIYSAYNDLFQLTELQERKTRKKVRTENKDNDKVRKYDIGISRIVDSVVEIIFAEMKNGKDERIEQYNSIFDREEKRFFVKLQERLRDSKIVSTDINLLKVSLRKNLERKRKDLKELFELPDQHENFYKPSLYKYIFDFGEIYFLIGYCLQKNKTKFFDLINVSEKKDEFLQQYVSIGKNFIDNMGVLMDEQRGIERRTKLQKSIKKQNQSNNTQIEDEAVPIAAKLNKIGQVGDKFKDVQPQKPYLKLNLPEVTKFKMVTAYDILDELLLNVPLETADTIDIQDVDDCMEQTYLLSLANPVGLCLIDDIENEGTVDAVVIVRDIFNIFHIFTVKEEAEGFPSEVEYKTIKGEEEFLCYFSDLINQYELPIEGDLELENYEEIYLSTVTDVLKALEKLTR